MRVEICEEHKILYYRFSEKERADKKLQDSLHYEQYEWLMKGYAVCDFLNTEEKVVKGMKDMLLRKTISLLAIAESRNKSRNMTDSLPKLFHFPTE